VQGVGSRISNQANAYRSQKGKAPTRERDGHHYREWKVAKVTRGALPSPRDGVAANLREPNAKKVSQSSPRAASLHGACALRPRVTTPVGTLTTEAPIPHKTLGVGEYTSLWTQHRLRRTTELIAGFIGGPRDSRTPRDNGRKLSACYSSLTETLCCQRGIQCPRRTKRA
jgi:hypothetical protein